jgi:hypothetical protein
MINIKEEISDNVCDSVSEIWDNIFLIITTKTLDIVRYSIRDNIRARCSANIQSNIYQHIRIKQKEL